MDLTRQYGFNAPYHHPQSFNHLGAATPQTPREDLNQFGNANASNFLPSGTNGNLPAQPLLTSSIHPDSVQPSKEATVYYDESLYNGHCKEEQQCIPPHRKSFGVSETPTPYQGPISSTIEPQVSQNENCFTTAENSGYPVQVPPSIEAPSTKGLFGRLPHEEVMSRHSRFERNDTFISPVAVPSTVASSHNNGGPYSEANGLYSPANAPQSVQSTFSGDTASLSPPVPIVNNSNFSSPSDYYSSPKGASGVYNNMQSPVPKSPSVPPHTVPTSPFAMEAMNHIPPTPCSPIGTATFPGNMNAVQHHQRPTSQPSPIPTQNFMNTVSGIPHPTQTSVSSTNFASSVPQHQGQNTQHSTVAQSQNFASNLGALPPQHPRPTPQSNRSAAVGFSNSMNNIPQPSNSSMETVMTYGASQSQSLPCHGPPSVLAKSEYQDYDVYSAPTPYPSTFQSMYPSTSCQVPATQYRGRAPSVPPMQTSRYSSTPMMSPMMNNHNQMGFTTPKHDMDMYPNHIDPPIHNPNTTNNISNFLDKDLPVLDTDMYANRQPHPSTFQDTYPRTRHVKQEVVNDGYAPNVFENNFNKYSPMDYNTRPYRARRARRPRGSYTPRRRGRRGRRRKSEFFSDVSHSYREDMNSSATASDLINFGDTDNLHSSVSDRMCDQNELPPSYSYGRYRSELKTECYQRKWENCLIRPADNAIGLYEELGCISGVCLPNRRFTRNQRIRDTLFIGKFQQFLNSWEACQDSEEPVSIVISSKEVKQIKNPPVSPEPVKEEAIKKEEGNNHKGLKLVLVRHPQKQWHVERKSTSSRSKSRSDSQSASQLSSHKIKVEIESEGESETGNLAGSYPKYRSKRSGGHSDILIDFKELLRLTNFEHLSAGKVKNETVKDTLGLEPQQNAPKKRGRKRKKPIPDMSCPSDIKALKSENTDNPSAISVKKKTLDDDTIQVISSRRSSLRQRKNEDFPIEPVPGPSFSRATVIDVSSDGFDNFDDSDSDPAWMPASKVPKPSDQVKSLNVPCHSKKRGSRGGRRTISPSPKKRRKSSGSASKKQEAKDVDKRKKETAYSRRKKSKAPEQYLIAKADLNLSTPHLWKVDKKTHMLQRFDVCEQNGVLLYKESFTYAAYNEISVSNYVTAKVNVVNNTPLQHKVEYLGPNLAESAENVVLEVENSSSKTIDKQPIISEPAQEEHISNDLANVKENFEVYIQSLISQSLDNSFLMEINKENDLYFLSSIKEIDSVSEGKKNKLLQESWNEVFVTCLETYPDLDVLDKTHSDLGCEACGQKYNNKLLKFGGQPYNCTTLEQVDAPKLNKKEFFVCLPCSTSIRLYNRLHHQKYIFFVMCRAKMIEAKGDNEELMSHALLEKCLRDHIWINKMFDELIQTWQDCPKDR